MGDRVVMQVIDTSTGEFGPVVYSHWAGSEACSIVRKLAKVMEDRPNDVSYSSARLVQAAIGDDIDSCGFGIWNTSAVLTVKDSHGDAGVILIDCNNGHKCECFGGYLKVGEDGFPTPN